MIRLLHFADLHLGVENYGRLDPETGLSSRLSDFLTAFDFVVDYAIREEIDLVLFAGDAFKNRDPSPTHQREFARRIRRLSEANVPTVLLVGNHDLPNALKRAHAIEIFHTLEIPSITVAERPDLYPVETRQGTVQVAALPWVTPSHLLARFPDLVGDSLLEKMEQGIHRIISGLAARLDEGQPAVLLAHGTAQGAVFGAERNVLLGHDVLLPRSLLADPRFAYVALGHIHKHQALNEQPPIVYSGSIERIDFGEAKEAKGFVVAEIADGPTRWHFVETPTRPFRQIAIDVRRSGDPMADVRAVLARTDVTGAVVKVIVQAAPENEAHLDTREIRRLLGEAAHVAAVVKDVERPARLRLGSAQEIASAAPRELLARYFEARQVPPEHRATLLRYAESIFSEEG